MEQGIEKTAGYSVAITFKPFIDPKCSEHMEIVNDMARVINSVIKFTEPPKNELHENLKVRVKQFLSALDYGALTDYQAKCVLLLEMELQKCL